MVQLLRYLMIGVMSGVVLRNVMRRKLPVKGQVVLITGGSRGLGFALARQYAQHGSLVNICARNLDELKAAQAQINADGLSADVFQCDVSNQDEVDALIKAVINRHGRLDVLVNNAGIIEVAPVSRLTVSDFKQVMDINFWGTVYTTWASLPYLKKSPFARVVNIASLGGEMSIPRMLTYCCSKFAVAGFSQGLAAELRHRNIPVLTVSPSLLRTGSYLQALFKGVSPSEIFGFAFVGNQPGLSVDANRAARKIFEASNQGKLYQAIGYQASLSRILRGMVPGSMIRLLGLVNTLIEKGTRNRVSQKDLKTGSEFPEYLPSKMLIPLGERAARELNQRTG